MTDRERAIVMAYTGVSMLGGEAFGVFLDYCNEKMGRYCFMEELGNASFQEELKMQAMEDFLSLCRTKEAEDHSAGKEEREAGPEDGRERTVRAKAKEADDFVTGK